MKKKIIVIASLAVFLLSINMFNGYKPNAATENLPKLVVGIVVDQMTYDFIPRYMNKYTDDGFKKMISGGFFCTNANFIHFPTYTAVGHTCIYTGTVPAINGICSNDWVDSGRTFYRYCADDSNYSTVGSSSEDGRMSPSSLMTNTITDQLRISSGMKSRVFGIALKDRGGIFPAGHKGNAVYWFDTKAKGWITSSYYMNELPEWVNEFNGRGLPQKYLGTVWNTMLPPDEYTESLPDDNDFEDTFKGKERPVFPYDLQNFRKRTAICFVTHHTETHLRGNSPKRF
ncbi:MAG: alkaline phosphatase family protein [Ignavibacteria bacterium]